MKLIAATMVLAQQGYSSLKNPHIELVKKWLNNPKSVSQEELERAAAAADAAGAAAYAYSAVAYAAADAAVAAAAAAAEAAAAEAASISASIREAKQRVKEYEELTQ